MKYGHGSLAWVGTFWSAVLSCADRIDVQITGMHETYSSSFSYFVGEWYSVWSVSVPTASHHDLGSTGFTELNRDLAQLKPRQVVAYTAAHASGNKSGTSCLRQRSTPSTPAESSRPRAEAVGILP